MSKFYFRENVTDDLRDLLLEDDDKAMSAPINKNNNNTGMDTSSNIMTSSNASVTGNISSKIIDHYIVLDSFSKIKTSSTEYGEFRWIFNTQGLSSDESIGVPSVIDYVTEIQIGSFYMPIIEDIKYIDTSLLAAGTIDLVQNNTSDFNTAPTLIRKATPGLIGQYPFVIFTDPTETYKIPWTNNPYTQIPFSNRISIQIKEANLQTYINPNNTRFNFEFVAMYDTRLHNNPNFLQVQPISTKWDFFTFNTPLRDFNSVTLIFRNPDNTISFEPDVMYKSIISLTPDGTGSHITLFTQFAHKLNAGDRIYLKNFKPVLADGSPNYNFPQYILNYILRNDGHVVNVVAPPLVPSVDPAKPLPDDLSFGLDPSIKLLDPIDPSITISFPGLVDIFIAKRRIRIPMKIKCAKK